MRTPPGPAGKIPANPHRVGAVVGATHLRRDNRVGVLAGLLRSVYPTLGAPASSPALCGQPAKCPGLSGYPNTLKHQGYQLEHNYGHGQKHLTTVFGLLMMLAFLVDQVQELCCNLFQTARQQFRSRTSLWDKLKRLFKEYFVVSWENVWLAIIYGHKGGVLQPDTS